MKKEADTLWNRGKERKRRGGGEGRKENRDSEQGKIHRDLFSKGKVSKRRRNTGFFI